MGMCRHREKIIRVIPPPRFEWKFELLGMSRSDITVARRPLVWLNVVCLDAPSVACAWQWLFARNFGITLPMTSQFALFFTAWLIYLIDRFADSISLRKSSEKTLREAFCLRHTNVWIALILSVALFDGAVILRRLDHGTLVAGAFLGAIAMIYLAVNFAFNKIWSAIPIKEIAVGFLFAAGTLVSLLPYLASVGSATTRSAFELAAFLFAWLCSLNCISVAVWERDLDLAQGKHSIATRWPHVKTFVRILAGILAVTSFLFGVVKPQLSPLADCFAISAIALLSLHFLSIARDERTALADLVLLTPIGWLLIGGLA